MSDADCTPGREPRSVAASLITTALFRLFRWQFFCVPLHLFEILVLEMIPVIE